MISDRPRQGFQPRQINRFVTVNPENLLGQRIPQRAVNAGQLLLVDLQVDRLRQLIAKLLVQLIQQLTPHIDDFV
ncbi:hypothetical protein D3C80_1107830 [compost metagenome]